MNFNFVYFNRDDPYENIEVKYKILQQKDDQVKEYLKKNFFFDFIFSYFRFVI
jgi:hypothetical protein